MFGVKLVFTQERPHMKKYKYHLLPTANSSAYMPGVATMWLAQDTFNNVRV
jgi:hypothetical protein